MVQTYDPEPVWDKPVDVPERWIQNVDDNILASQSCFTQTPHFDGLPES